MTFKPDRTGASGASSRPRPYDPRLLHLARAARTYLVVAVAVGGLTALLVVAQAWLLATSVAGAFIHGKNLGQLRGPVGLLLLVILARAGLGWASELAANRASASTKSDLRNALVERIALLGPAGLDRDRTGGLATLATKGVDTLDSYFARYLPQLFLAVIVPLTVVVVVAGNDWISAIIIALTVPLVPVFMILVGSATTRQRTGAKFRTLQRLAGHFLDVVAGLPTLKVFGRSKAQVAAIRESTDRYRETTMATLRVAFVSSLILELLATLSVALVAVAIGLRLLGGHLDLRPRFRPRSRTQGVPAAAAARYELPRQRGGDQGLRTGLRGARATAPGPGQPLGYPRQAVERTLGRGACRDLSGSPRPGAAGGFLHGGAGRGVGAGRPERLVASRRFSACSSDWCARRPARFAIGGRCSLDEFEPDCWRLLIGMGAAAAPPVRDSIGSRCPHRAARRDRQQVRQALRDRGCGGRGRQAPRGTRYPPRRRRGGLLAGSANVLRSHGRSCAMTTRPARRTNGEPRRSDRGGRAASPFAS